MKPRMAIVAALPREVAPLVDALSFRMVQRSEGASVWECDGAILVCAGMGRERVTRAVELAESRGPLHSILSAGYAGALRTGMAIDIAYWPATVIDAQTGERFFCKDGSGTLVTTDHVADGQEKSALAGRWNADLVDMEAAAVARLAQIRKLPFRTVRAISDEAAESLPDPGRFTNEYGGFRERAFAMHVALHPWLIPAAIRMGKRAGHGSRTIAQAICHVMEQAE